MNFKEFYMGLDESVNDKPLLKYIFMAGGPGSGKSFISDTMFKGENVQYINSDVFFEHLLNKNNLPFVVDRKNRLVYVRQQDKRDRAGEIANIKLGNSINGLLCIIMDGTGRKYQKIKNQYDIMKELGYDCHMIFVNTSLDIAKKRNALRKRKLDDDLVEDFWNAVQNNLGEFQSLFGNSNFHIVDNNKMLVDEELMNFKLKLIRMAKKILAEPLKNPTGINTIQTLKKTGGKYLFDLTPDVLSKYKIEV